ncbi:MAG: hypothetical protein QOG20_3267 [Pseudonocardiales bacterium]|jgi:hypothetical protein|nr:hypothetical protein [Pseudonocardiales bacterium]
MQVGEPELDQQEPTGKDHHQHHGHDQHDEGHDERHIDHNQQHDGDHKLAVRYEATVHVATINIWLRALAARTS